MKKQKKNAFPYFPPVVEIMDVTAENGFALSTLYYNTAASTTDQLDVKTEWNRNEEDGEGENFF